MSNLIKKEYEGQEVTFDLSGNGMVNATEMAKACGKQISDFMRLDSTEEYMEALSSDMDIPRSQLIFTEKGNYSDGRKQGTWVHRRLALRVAQWCSPHFAVQVDGWIEELFTKGKVEINQNSNQSLSDEFQDKIKIANILGFEGNQAIILANRYMRKVMNKDILEIMEVQLPDPKNETLLTPTQIGKILGNQSPQSVNLMLSALDLQVKSDNIWILTEEGKKYGQNLFVDLEDRKGIKSQIKWYQSVIPLIKEYI
jgi:hypothetical protein